MTHETHSTVELQRSVRFGRLLIGGAVVGAAVAAFASLLFPTEEGALYTMAQIVGFMLIIGGAIGLGLGGVLALVLSAVAKRRTGTGVVERIIIEEDPDAEVPEAPETEMPAAGGLRADGSGAAPGAEGREHGTDGDSQPPVA